MKEPLRVGDKVKYSVQFLRSTGQYTGDIPFAQEQQECLAKSIEHWELALKGKEEIGAHTCSLCERFGCYMCPIQEQTGQSACDGTPYNPIWIHIRSEHFKYKIDKDCEECKRLGNKELKFLKDLYKNLSLHIVQREVEE